MFFAQYLYHMLSRLERLCELEKYKNNITRNSHFLLLFLSFCCGKLKVLRFSLGKKGTMHYLVFRIMHVPHFHTALLEIMLTSRMLPQFAVFPIPALQ
jgi:hypothetical protein